MTSGMYVAAFSAMLSGCAAPTSAVPHKISYVEPTEITAPGPNVPSIMRAYSGVWIGRWDDTWDAVIVVKTVRADGTVDMEYRWIDRVGQPYAAAPNLQAQIEDGVLVSGSIHLALDPLDPLTARGDVMSTAIGRPRHSLFKKQVSAPTPDIPAG